MFEVCAPSRSDCHTLSLERGADENVLEGNGSERRESAWHPGLIQGLEPFTDFAVSGNTGTTPLAAFAFSCLHINQAAKMRSLLQRYVYLRIDWISLINLAVTVSHLMLVIPATEFHMYNTSSIVLCLQMTEVSHYLGIWTSASCGCLCFLLIWFPNQDFNVFSSFYILGLDGSEKSSCSFPKLSKLSYLKPKIGVWVMKNGSYSAGFNVGQAAVLYLPDGFLEWSRLLCSRFFPSYVCVPLNTPHCKANS